MTTPLAEKLRPKKFTEIIGQDHLVGKEGFLTQILEKKLHVSILLWGPPGCGKTTIARAYANALGLQVEYFHPMMKSLVDLKKLLQKLDQTPLFQQSLVLFVDEIHRINKAGQDIFLPYLERGSILLIGATTENPSFALNDALLSRLRLFTLAPLKGDHLMEILERFEMRLGKKLLETSAKKWLITQSGGDGRHLLNMLENIEPFLGDKRLKVNEIAPLVQQKAALFDKQGEGHYNLISALHKAVRGSDPNAAVYWLARLLNGGEQRRFIARRLIRMAMEDIGLADPSALTLANAAFDTYEKLGSPEGELAFYELVIYLALSPKSNTAYLAQKGAESDARQSSHLPPPKHILNAPTKMMRDLDYGAGYLYDHDEICAYSGQDYFPEGMDERSYYTPVERGFERELKKRIDYFVKLKHQKRST